MGDGKIDPETWLPANTPRADHEFVDHDCKSAPGLCHFVFPNELLCLLPRSAHPRPEPAEREPEHELDSPNWNPPQIAELAARNFQRINRHGPAAGDHLANCRTAALESAAEAMARALEPLSMLPLPDSYREHPTRTLYGFGDRAITIGDVLRAEAALASWRALEGK